MNGYIIIDQSSTAAHTANWCARFSHMFHHQSWPKRSNPIHSRLWQAAGSMQRFVNYQFEIQFHWIDSLRNRSIIRWACHIVEYTKLIICSTIHSFEERSSGDWNLCHQSFWMYPCITVISTTQLSANQCLKFALCSTKLFPALQCMITVCCEQNTQHAKWLNPWMNQITMTIAHSANWCAHWILAGSYSITTTAHIILNSKLWQVAGLMNTNAMQIRFCGATT